MMIMMTTTIVAALIALTTSLAGSCHGLTPVNTSLATLPMGYFGGLTAHPRPAENLAMLGKQRLVMIEKWEGPCWAECVANTTKHIPCQSSCYAERDMLETIRTVKTMFPHVAVGYYQNSLYDWTMQMMHAQFAEINGNMRDINGKLIGIRQDDGLMDQNIFALNHEDVVDLYLTNQRNLSRLGFVDGSYLDKPTDFPIYNATHQAWTICELPWGAGMHPFNVSCAIITAEQAMNYTRGKQRLLAEVRKIWEPLGGFVLGVANSSVQLTHCNPGASDSPEKATVHELNTTLQQYLSDVTVKSIFICVQDQTWDTDPADTAGYCSVSLIAKLMMVLEEGIILGCDGWQEDFGKPLGNPIGPAVWHKKDKFYERHFASGTYARFHAGSGVGQIFWSDGSASK